MLAGHWPFLGHYLHVLLWGVKSFLGTQKYTFPLCFPWLTWTLNDCWLSRDLQMSTQECMQSLTNCNNLFLMSLRKHTNRFSSTCLFPRTPVWPFIKSAEPSPFIYLLFQLCEQWCICLQTPCPGKFLEKRIIGKNIACFWASSGI